MFFLAHRKKRRGHSSKQRTACFQFHFACPIFRCPDGMAFALAPNGCRECRCIPIGRLAMITCNRQTIGQLTPPPPPPLIHAVFVLSFRYASNESDMAFSIMFDLL